MNKIIKMHLRKKYKKYTIQEVHLIAQERGGYCLSTEVKTIRDNLIWKCSEGHIWITKLRHVIEGHWCHKCAHNKLRHSIEKCHKLASDRNGKCLSTKYINTDTRIEWECENGHRWWSPPSKVKQGRWCPFCVGKYKNIEYYKALAIARWRVYLKKI